MGARYRQFLRLLEEWPLDKQKAGRDFGQYLRERVALSFRHGEASQITDMEYCDRSYEALTKIRNNTYKNMYPRIHTATTTGCSLEECQIVTSTESINYLRDQEGLPPLEPKEKTLALHGSSLVKE